MVAFERGRGLRIMGDWRNTLDRKVGRAAFIVQHVDWGAFFRHLATTVSERVLHDIAHGVLRLVRSTERLLTRTVRTLRERRGVPVVDDADELSPFQASLLRARMVFRNARHAARKTPKPVRSVEEVSE